MIKTFVYRTIRALQLFLPIFKSGVLARVTLADLAHRTLVSLILMLNLFIVS